MLPEVRCCTILITNEHFAIQHAVVAEDVVEHFLIEIFRRCGERDLHATRFLLFEIDVRWILVESNADCFQFCFQESSLLCSFRGVQDHEDHVARLAKGE